MEEKTKEMLQHENEVLRGRLRDAEEVPGAIRLGGVDAPAQSDAQGERIHMLSGAEERTEELRALRARLETMNREFQEFIAVASHDLQEPLRKIQTFCSQIKAAASMDLLDEASRGDFKRIQRSAKRMQDLIRAFLSYSHAFKNPEPSKIVDLNDIVQKVREELLQDINKRKAEVRTWDLPSVEADSFQMHRLFKNLLENALKFSRDDPPEIKIYGELIGGAARIFVEDNGMGFHGRYQARLFKPFQQFHRRGAFAGIGIGLAVCRKIVENHDGTITVESVPGVGSKFMVTLPLMQSTLGKEVRLPKDTGRTKEELLLEIYRMKERLRESEEVLSAIREGKVDALVASESGGEKVYTLKGADRAYRILFDTMSEGAVTLSPDGTVLYGNLTFETMLGHPLAKVVGTSFFDFVAQKDRGRLPGLFAEAQGKGAKGEIRLLAKEGKELPVRLSVSPLELDDGSGFCIIVSDLSEEKRMQEELREHRLRLEDLVRERTAQLHESEERYRFLFERNPVGVFVVDPGGRFVLANAACESIAGFTVEELRQKTFMELCAPDQMANTAKHFERSLREFQYQQFETALIRKDGRRVDLWVAGDVLTRDGEVAAIQCTAIDITDRKRALEQLSYLSEMSQALNRINEALHSSLDFDEVTRKVVEEGSVTLGSETAALSLRQDDGWTVWHVHGLQAGLIGLRMTDTEERHALQAIRSGEPVIVEDAFSDERCDLEHMRRYNIRAVLVAPLISHGRPIGVIYFNYHAGPHRFTVAEMNFARQLAATASIALENARIFSDLEDAQEALRKARDLLECRVAERTAELKERADQLARLSFQITLAEQRERRRLAVIIHDHLQQLLVGAKIGIERMTNRLDGDEQKKSREICNLVVECLKTARSLNAQLSPTILYERGLGNALIWLAENMRETYGLDTKTQIDPDIEIEQEHANVLLFESVRELLFNVVKHARASSAHVEMLRDDSDCLRITVRDQGVGVDRERVFENPGDDHFGLFTIRERMELIGGNLEIESSPGQGAAFSLIAPAERLLRPKKPSEKATGSPPGKAVTAPTRTEKIKVLLVDDHAVVREGLSSLLGEHSDIEIAGEAADGEEAVQMARRLQPDVILMDISMPKMNGIEATGLIHSESPYIRTIGLSMYDDPETAKAMRDAGAVAFLNKGGHSDALVTAIRQSMDDENRQVFPHEKSGLS